MTVNRSTFGLGGFFLTLGKLAVPPGEPTTKLQTAVDALDNPLQVIHSVGQIVDFDQSVALIQYQPAEFIAVSKGFDLNDLVITITEQDSQAAISATLQ